jgi:hypothetical protein
MKTILVYADPNSSRALSQQSCSTIGVIRLGHLSVAAKKAV